MTYKISLYHFGTKVLFKVSTVAVLMFASHVLQNYLSYGSIFGGETLLKEKKNAFVAGCRFSLLQCSFDIKHIAKAGCCD